ncbi:GntR family transcriptional regulator [Halalkalibacter nanhaiisediminis]|uniref:DNA-binding GntR family transcriptional regulator n=1 Tax=Halalkalibacter nanhaiisediminis TaxID=688079 RepID=A0A562QPW7_9BACI|nr:GntR family transcriptional regulator [Halalkalibacter nanhaiisediminis]TWI58106.1 DNA-binding GntR family transcriptional regulator [Halalkalibacter nanhaiisediminis]
MKDKIDLRIEERDTLHLKVCSVLRKAILKGDFKPGERLVQSELAESMGVSRMPIREALRKLETEGLVSLEPHKGAIIKPIKMEDIIEIYELRSFLESKAVELSVEHLTKDEINQLEDLVNEMSTAKSIDAFVESNIIFHKLLIKHCHWTRLTTFIETLWNGFPQETPQIISGQLEKSNVEHQEILQVVKNKDSKKASSLISAHISRTGSELVARLKENQN